MKLSLPPNTSRQDETQVTKYWVFGPLTRNSHIQDDLLTISQAPIMNIKTGIVEGGEDYHLITDDFEQICVPPFPSLLDGLVHLINKT
jgi:hypothetical protein